MTATVQPQSMPQIQPQPQEFRTPEEIMVTLLAQTIILSVVMQQISYQLPLEKKEPETEMQKEGEKGAETLKNKESQKFEQKATVRAAVSSTPSILKRSEPAGMVKPHEMMSRMLQKQGERKQPHTENKAPLDKQSKSTQAAATSHTQATSTKQQTTPLFHHPRFQSDQKTVREEPGTSRRSMPQGPRHTIDKNQHIFERKVDKDREENQQKKRHFSKRKVSKGGRSGKIDRVARQHFEPAARNDFEHFLRTMMQDSELSQFFGTRVSHFDVLALFIELMKLEVEDNHQERVARLDERKYQIQWMESVVKQYKSQAKFLLFAGVGSGVLGVLSGALPIIGHAAGDSILNKLKMISSNYNNMRRAKAFDNMSKICFSMSEMNKAMGQVQSSFCEGERSWSEHQSSIHRTDGEESTRTIEERTREFKNWNDILAQILRMEQDLARQLYS